MIQTLIVAVLLFAMAGPAFSQDGFTESQKKEIGELIRSYLLKNPEVISEAAEVLQKREEAARLASAKKAIKQNKRALERADGDPIGGNADGSVTVV